VSAKSLGGKMKKSVLKWEINRILGRLARTESKDEFYEEFDEILQGLYSFAGPNRAAMDNVKKAFQQRHPWAELSRILLQDRISKVTREKLAENFFCDWVMEAKKRDKLEETSFKAPWFFVISPTVACNLHCYGCYAHEYSRTQGLSYQTLDRILREAKELGIRFLTISGGEPFYYKDRKTGQDILDLFEEHNDVFFQVYTNGTLLDDKKIERLAKLGNVAPSISVEGFKKETDERRGKGVWEKIEEARENLHQAGILEGFSITVTRENAKPEILRKVVQEYGAYPTHQGAETIIQGAIAQFLDKYSREMDRVTRSDFERMMAGDYDTSIVKLSQVIKNHREKNRKEVEIQSKKNKVLPEDEKEKGVL